LFSISTTVKTTDKAVTVLLVDDNAPVRHGLRALLDKDALIRVVGEARDGQEAVELARKFRPKVILMDISMPVMNGLEATGVIMAERPTTKVIIVSAQEDEGYVSRAKAVGAVGYVGKQRAAETLIRAIHDASHGILRFSASKTPLIGREGKAEGPSKASEWAAEGALTAEDSALLKLVSQGVPKRQIASRQHTRISTIERRIQALMAKLGITSLLKLAEYGVALGCTDNDVEVVIV
jgi:two-component system, NarL family, nitrate/nitrite response regulator NarL